jgi:serine protease Do
MQRWSLLLAGLLLAGGIGSLVGRSFLQGQAPAAAVASAPASRELISYRNIVKKVLPAVVSIESQARTGRAKAVRREEAEDAPDDSRDKVGFGSGFLISPRGVVVTNHHVVAGADQAVVHLLDGRRFTSRDIKTDPKTDLAIIRLDVLEALPHLEFGDSDAMEIGDRVLAVGAPFGLTGTVTHGIVSAKGRSLRLNMYEDFLQTDAAINPGNSGGPLVNLDGQVIGITSAIKSRTGGFQGIGLAISSNLGRTILKQLLDTGVVRRGYLGVKIRELEDADAARLGGLLKERHGVVLTRVFEETPAAKGGLKAGDILLGLNGKPVKDGRELQTVVAGLPLGKPIEVVFIRDARKQTSKITVEEQPAGFGTGSEPGVPERALVLEGLGLEVTDLTPALAESLGYREGESGVVISKVRRDGPAAAAGLRPGWLLVAIDRRLIGSLRDVREALKAAPGDKGVLLRIQDPLGRVRQVRVQPE